METIEFEQEWEFVQKGITKMKNTLEGLPEPQFCSEDRIMLFTTIYNMCTQKPPHDYCQQLYDKYRESFVEYIDSTVLPSLREKHDEFMLRELVKRWANHKVMVRWLSRFFHYLDRYFVARNSLATLYEVGLTCFRELVYQEIKGKVRDAVISLIDQEREGEQIDRALLKNVLDIFVEIGMGSLECYESDFEVAMLEDTAAYYSRKAAYYSRKVSNWILEDSCPDYMLKIEQEREGEQIDRALLKNVLDIFVEIGKGSLERYESDFEAAMLKDTAAYDSRKAAYYSRKASNWILEDSCPDYMLKAVECMKREKDRVSHYLHSSSEQKLLETVQHEFLFVYAIQLLQNEHSGCHALLRDDKVEDLSGMYRRFCRIPRVLDPASEIFKQHVTAEGTALVKQAEDAASNKKAEKRDVVGLPEQVFVRKVIELHDKYLAYVNDCFMNHSLFHKALKEAFEIFCNKGVAGSSSAELLATFCDNILKKGGTVGVRN